MDRLLFYILNYEFRPIGVVDAYKSAIWTERFYTSGDFELYVPNTDLYSGVLRLPENGHSLYILRADDLTKLGIIDSISYVEDIDSGDMILVKGHTDDYLLHYRLIMEQVTYSGNVELAIRHMVKNAFIQSEFGYTDRVSSQFSLGEKVNLDIDVNLQYQGQYMDEEIGKLAKENGFGFKIDYNDVDSTFTFKLIKPVDRSLDQTQREPVVFSATLDNMSNSEYNKSSEINTAYAYGEGNGSFKYSKEYVLPAVRNYALERKEANIDAKSTSNNGDAIHDWMYGNLLYSEARGAVYRAKNSGEKVQADILANTNYKLGVDYDLGDVVQVVVQVGNDRSLIRSFKQRVIEVIEAFDENGYSCIPTFETVEN